MAFFSNLFLLCHLKGYRLYRTVIVSVTRNRNKAFLRDPVGCDIGLQSILVANYNKRMATFLITITEGFVFS